ncbi:MAG: cytidine deaminase [Chitinophagaceae bacterium]|jgi:cytidine deaminase|nr:cytidine deaminase [Chitinophagaceae bacterium]
MQKQELTFQYEVFESSKDLSPGDKALLDRAKEATGLAYAPYSKFHVGAAARLVTGELVVGSNQENASFPVGICAERVLLSALSSLYPETAIETMAITYKSKTHPGGHPVAPCGICRQSLSEFENRMQKSFRIILGGENGKIFIIPEAGMLLPLAFTSDDLK